MDIYDQAVEYLSKRVESNEFCLWGAWEAPSKIAGGILFEFTDLHRSGECGCLTQIRSGAQGPTPELTERIRADERLPFSGSGITVDMLPVFAEWQRVIDAELGRPAPEKI